jgi:alkylated DNA repair dioxygenase AlkB
MSAVAEQSTAQKFGTHSYLGPHIDSCRCFGPEIVTFSLVSAAQFRLTDQKGRRRLTVTLNPGDVVVLQGEARQSWKHEILRHKRGRQSQGEDPNWRRLSVTFRTVMKERIQG